MPSRRRSSTRKARTSRKTFVCHCGDCVAIGGEFYTYPEKAKMADKPEKFCSAKCCDNYIKQLNSPTVPVIVEPVQEAAHHAYSPSSLLYREACPGYSPSTSESVAATRGTIQHAACERSDLTTFPTNFDLDGTPVVLDSWEVDSVEAALSGVRSIIAATVEDFALDPPPEVFKELRLEVEGLTYGTADLVLIWEFQAILIDYKFGAVAVAPAEINPQGLAYVAGLFEAHPSLDHVRLCFIQPKLGTVDYHDHQRADVMGEGVDRLAAIISRARAYDSGELGSDSLRRTESCRFCSRIGVCPAVQTAVVEVAGNYSPELVVPEIADPATWTTGEHFSDGLALAKVIEAWPAAVRKAALAFMLEEGEAIPGYATQERKSSRKLRSLGLVWRAVEAEYGIELLDFLESCSMSISDLEKLVKAGSPRGEKAATAEILKSLLREKALLRGGDSTHTILVKEKK